MFEIGRSQVPEGDNYRKKVDCFLFKTTGEPCKRVHT